MSEPTINPIAPPTQPKPGASDLVEKPPTVVTILAELPPRSLLDERALAEALGVSKRTVRRMVSRYELPPPTRFAGRSMWQAGRVLAWFEERADKLARDAERRARKIEQLG